MEAYLSALEKTVGYDIVASPWVMALNHEPAYILIGSKYGYKTSIVSQTSTIQEIRFLEVGTKLNFTPHINEDGFIIMDLYPAISDGSVKDDLPQEDTTETKNRVLVKDGQSVVIGGLTKKFDREVVIGLPILSSIPFLGNLFRRTEIQSEKREVMVIVTPRIVTPAFLQEASDQAADLETRRQEWSEKAKILRK
jgi:type II secretory pathway component GspD/PulD (secretin)